MKADINEDALMQIVKSRLSLIVRAEMVQFDNTLRIKIGLVDSHKDLTLSKPFTVDHVDIDLTTMLISS
jgi:hypothetical protein